MKILLKALLWSAGFEALLVLLWGVGFLGLPILSYVALWMHFPALYLWPATGDLLIAVFLFQWFIWYVLSIGVLSLKRACGRPTAEHETKTG